MAKYNQEHVVDYIQVNSGRRFYVLNPRKEDIIIEDIAHALSNLCRFTGHGDRFYCVGEHSILCYLVAKELNLSPKLQMYALCHDASEAVMNDLARPVKQQVPQYKEVEDNVMKVMWEVVGVPCPTQEEYEIVKKIDNTVLLLELTQLMKRDLKDYPKLDVFDVYIRIGDGYNALESKADFLNIYNDLIKQL